MSGRTEFKPTAVPFSAKQVGEAESRWGWLEPGVRTDRMLTALDTGVKGGQWFSLIDKVYRERNLFAAFRILRKRHKRKGRGEGWDHLRGKNAYFAERGLYCLRQAHVSVRQSSLR